MLRSARAIRLAASNDTYGIGFAQLTLSTALLMKSTMLAGSGNEIREEERKPANTGEFIPQSVSRVGIPHRRQDSKLQVVLCSACVDGSH